MAEGTWPLESELPPVSGIGPNFSGLGYKWLTLLATVAGYVAYGGPKPPEHVILWTHRVTRHVSFLRLKKERRRLWIWVHVAEPWLPRAVTWWPR